MWKVGVDRSKDEKAGLTDGPVAEAFSKISPLFDLERIESSLTGCPGTLL